MNRIKRISMQLLEKYGDMFSTDFDNNKEVLNKVAIIRSKGLRNEIAGYITGYMKLGMNGKHKIEEKTNVDQESE